MRSKLGPGLLVAVTSLVVTGCQSTQSVHPFWGTFGKNKTPSASSYAGAPGGPPLPSQQAASTTAPPYTPSTPPASYGPASGTPANYGAAPSNYPNTYGATGAASPYPTTGAQQTNYTNAAPADTYRVNPPPGYPATSPSTSPAGIPQSGSYSSVYGGQPNNGAASNADAAAASAGQRYVSEGGRDIRGDSTARDPGADRSAPGYDTGSPYESQAAENSSMAERRYERNAGPVETRVEYGDQDEASRTDRPVQSTAVNHAESSDDRYAEAAPRRDYRSDRNEEFVPGETGYRPGRTGYDPPGVPEYQLPVANNAMQPASQSMERRDPSYRPGGTSDYLPAGGRRYGAAGNADRTATRGSAPTGYDAGPADDVRTAVSGDRRAR